MNNPEESFDSPDSSAETLLLILDVAEILKRNIDTVIIVTDDFSEEIFNTCILGGKLESETPEDFEDVTLTNTIWDGDGEISTIVFGNSEYMINNGEIISAENPGSMLEYEELMDLRAWLSETIWSKEQTSRLAANYIRQA